MQKTICTALIKNVHMLYYFLNVDYEILNLLKSYVSSILQGVSNISENYLLFQRYKTTPTGTISLIRYILMA